MQCTSSSAKRLESYRLKTAAPIPLNNDFVAIFDYFIEYFLFFIAIIYICNELRSRNHMSSVIRKTLASPQDVYRDHLRRCIDASGEAVVMLSHFGGLCAHGTDGLLKVFENSLIALGEKRSFVKRFCALFIEVAQNICIHGARDKNGLTQSFIIIVKDQSHYKILCGNLILAQDVTRLHAKFEEIENLSNESLHRLYIETLSNDEFSTKGGAGLGLLTIARKSEGRFSHKIEPLDDQFAYLTLDIPVH